MLSHGHAVEIRSSGQEDPLWCSLRPIAGGIGRPAGLEVVAVGVMDGAGSHWEWGRPAGIVSTPSESGDLGERLEGRVAGPRTLGRGSAEGFCFLA